MTTYIGLIGADGNITETHARAARALSGVEIAAVHGTNAEKVARLCREYGGKPYSDLAEFLDHRPMDLVAIGSPSGLHAAQGIAAAQRGLHVLTEKPIDITTERADALIAATDKAGVKLGVFFQDRCKPDILRVKKAVGAGVLGRPILADARVKWFRPPDYYAKSRWRGTWALDGGGALINQAVHTVDLMQWLFGDVISVQATSKARLHAIEAEDTLVALFEFANGALGVLQAATSHIQVTRASWNLLALRGTLIIAQEIACSPRTCGIHPRTCNASGKRTRTPVRPRPLSAMYEGINPFWKTFSSQFRPTPGLAATVERDAAASLSWKRSMQPAAPESVCDALVKPI